jgi:hypothetical protein
VVYIILLIYSYNHAKPRLSPSESPPYEYINSHSKDSKFTLDVGLVDENFTFIHTHTHTYIYIYVVRRNINHKWYTSIRKRESEINGKNVQLSLTHMYIYIFTQGDIKFLLNY